jgi:4,5-dihydroxyphthalate decarboxylase
LHQDYGVAPDSVQWLTGGVNNPGRLERLELRTPPQYSIENIGPQRTLDEMLRAGEIDAIMSPEIPASFTSGDQGVERLFTDYRAEETAYFARTGIFPIMHLLVIRKTSHAREPGLARKLLDAFAAAKAQSFARLYDGDALFVMLPWLISEIEATMRTMGSDFWPYGVAKNRHVLAAFIQHLRDQGLINAPLDVGDLFAAEVLAI